MSLKQWRSASAVPAIIVAFLLVFGAGANLFAQKDASAASSRTNGDIYTLGNRTIEAKWKISNEKLTNLTVTDRLHHKTIVIASPFSLLFADGRVMREQGLHFTSRPSIQDLKGTPGASRYSDQLNGKQFEGVLEDAAGDVRVNFRIVLRDGSSYLRQVLTISAPHRDLPITDVRLIDLDLPGVQVVGTVAGSPLVAGNFFLGFEHPLSLSKANGDHAVADLAGMLPLAMGQSIIYSSVIGVAPTGQMRRGFLAYIEGERAHPYRTILHYNTWYDAGYFTPYDETLALDRVNAFGRELHEKRGVTLDSFLFDDGWDNHSSLWGFNKGPEWLYAHPQRSS